MRERRAGRLNRASPGPVLEAIQQAADERATTLWSVAIAYVACSGSTGGVFTTTMRRSASRFSRLTCPPGAAAKDFAVLGELKRGLGRAAPADSFVDDAVLSPDLRHA